ncbi:MAG: amidohydrolase family protein [bacterium]
MEKRIFSNWQQLAELDYFELLPDGRMALRVEGLDGLIDFHTHLGWTALIAPKVNLTRETPEMIHNFGRDLKVNLDIYMGQNFYEERPKWGVQDYLPCALSPLRRGKHHTHTVPNIIREMDALKIDKCVTLSLDFSFSSNTRRTGEALKNTDRLVFFCMVHPKNKRREQLIEEYVAMGARGMKVHPEMQMMSVSAEPMQELFKLWKEKTGGLPVLAHSGFNGFEPKSAREHADIGHYWKMAEALEGSPCILGHASMNQFRQAVEIAEKHPHVLLEVSGQPPAHLHEMMDRLGPDRLLFGSDWPVYPQAVPIAKTLIATEGNPEARIKILRDNARRVLGLS